MEMVRKFIYFCPNCRMTQKVDPQDKNRFICNFCGSKMKYEGVEGGDQPKVIRELNNQKEYQKKRDEEIAKAKAAYRASQIENIPRCPTCHSTKIKKIGAFERMASVGFWGPFSKKINKTFKCENCGYTW